MPATKLTAYSKRRLREMPPTLKEQAAIYNESLKTLRRMRRHIDKQLAREDGLRRLHEGQRRPRQSDALGMPAEHLTNEDFWPSDVLTHTERKDDYDLYL